MIFSTAYLPPVEFFVYAAKADKILIEACENYVKQTYRNRCCIYSANGKHSLVIPVEHDSGRHIPIKEVKIIYAMHWNRIHWRAINAAYNKSAYFMYYRDDFEKFFSGKYHWLFDFNHEIIVQCFRLLKLDASISYTDDFNKCVDDDDLRKKINPKIKSEITFTPYTQAFDTKHGFISNLSIIDLLFNCGPDSAEYLRNTALFLA